MTSPCARRERTARGNGRAAALALACLAAGYACSEPAARPSVGGNTNWLLACGEDAECGEQTSCVCGRCSAPCSASAACAQFPGATCADDVAAQVQCGAEHVGGVCLLACDLDADCDGDLACVQGACVERPEPTDCGDRPDALFCSGFDDPDLPEWSLTAQPQSTLATTDRYRHAGPLALEARASGFDSRSRYTGEFAPQTGGTLHLRAWMFVEPDAVIENIHTISIGDVDTGDWGLNLEFFEGAQAVETPTMLPAGDGVAIPRGRWFCVRAEITLAHDDGSVRVWLDEQPAVSMMGIDTLPTVGTHNLTAGVDHAAQQEHTSVFFDELLLDTQETPCGE